MRTGQCILLVGAAFIVAPCAVADGVWGDGEKIIPPLPLERPAPPKVRDRAFTDIDLFIAAEWAKRDVKPAPSCDDHEFARRVYLDLAGVIPTEREIRDFLDTDVKRRAKLIDRLLESNRYADHWAVYWGDLLREQTNVRGADPFAMRDYIRASLTANKPYDAWVREMLSADGTARDAPAAAFVLRHNADPVEMTITTTQVFLGVQVKCAECHDHPFEPWKQTDFEGMTRFFSRTRRREALVEQVTMGDRMVERRIDEVFEKEGAKGRFLTGAESDLGGGRDALAELVVRRDNPYFARTAVNRLWARMFGAGLVDPPDALSVKNPPSHPELLDWLAVEFVEHGYDLKYMLRLICNSRTYQLSSEGGRRPAELDENVRLFDRARLRRLTAEQLHDSILVSGGLVNSDRNRDQPAIDQRYPAGPSSFLTTFGAHDRQTIHERSDDATIPQALALLNGDFVNRAVSMHRTHPVLMWLQEGLPPERVVKKLFLQTLGREPTATEREMAMETADSEDGWSDLHWALVNTREFMFIR